MDIYINENFLLFRKEKFPVQIINFIGSLKKITIYINFLKDDSIFSYQLY